ncbi:hypothetical protein RN068_000715 [Salmonella enterica]|nr:hypothetical protein [Salmonella enterica]
MRYFLFMLIMIGGLLSFNVSASQVKDSPTPQQCIARPVLTDITMTSVWKVGAFYYANYQGCEYVEFRNSSTKVCILDSDGYLCDWKPTGNVVSSGDGGDSDNPDTKPDDKPDVTPPVIDVKPPKPDTGTTGSSGFSAALSSINSSSAESLYLSYPFDYNFNYTAEQNKQLAQAFLSKLSNVTPPSYYSVDHIYEMMERWQHYYNQLSTPTSSVTYLWNSSHFVGGEHRYLGSIVLAVYSCAEPNYQGLCYDLHKPLNINDPDYASRSDYKNGITRCMRNPNDPSCHSSGGDSSGGSGDTSGNHNVDIPGTGGSTPDTGDKPDNCPSGSHHEPGTMEGSCTTDLTPNPGAGGGSGSGSTDNNDNGDVVAAINAFHADNNKNHKELMDDLNKKPAPPDYTGMEGEFSSTVGGAMSGITDSVKSAWDAGKTAFGEGLSGIDSMLPNIKTSFDLPPGFEAASLGRCIPVVLDFDIKLVGIPDYHFHAVGTQVCLLYDKYIRPVLNFVMVMLSFFVIHRLLIRSAEFLTDGRN